MSADAARRPPRVEGGGRLVGVEGLRGVAAALVLVYHVGTVLTPATVRSLVPFVGWFDRGLTLFFVLSGFLLFRPFAAALLGSRERPPIRRYLRNRALRIWPAYVVVLLLVDGLLGAARLPGTTAFDRVVVIGRLDPTTLLADLLLVQTFVPTAMRTGLEVAWTLTVEASFYVVLPLAVLWAGCLRRGLRSALAPALLLLAVGVGTRVLIVVQTHELSATDAWLHRWGDRWSAVLSRSLLAQADLFAMGMLAAVLVALVESGRLSSDRIGRKTVWSIASVTGALGVLLPAAIGDDLFAVACAALLIAVVLPAVGAPRRVARLLERRPLRAAGLVSYSVYLWHLPLIRLLRADGATAPDTGWGLLVDVGIVGACTGALAAVTYFAVERPAQRLRLPRALSAARPPTST